MIIKCNHDQETGLLHYFHLCKIYLELREKGLTLGIIILFHFVLPDVYFYPFHVGLMDMALQESMRGLYCTVCQAIQQTGEQRQIHTVYIDFISVIYSIDQDLHLHSLRT